MCLLSLAQWRSFHNTKMYFSSKFRDKVEKGDIYNIAICATYPCAIHELLYSKFQNSFLGEWNGTFNHLIISFPNSQNDNSCVWPTHFGGMALWIALLVSGLTKWQFMCDPHTTFKLQHKPHSSTHSHKLKMFFSPCFFPTYIRDMCFGGHAIVSKLTLLL